MKITPDQIAALDRCKFLNKRIKTALAKDYPLAMLYVTDINPNRFPEAEPLFMTQPYGASRYARDVIKGRWPEAEPYIMKSPIHAYHYAHDIIKGPWPEAEPYILKNYISMLYYSMNILKHRWLEAEKILPNESKYWDTYKKHFGLE